MYSGYDCLNSIVSKKSNDIPTEIFLIDIVLHKMVNAMPLVSRKAQLLFDVLCVRDESRQAHLSQNNSRLMRLPALVQDLS